MTVASGDPGGTGLWLNLLRVSWMQRRACYVRACYVSGRGNGPLGSGMEWLIITLLLACHRPIQQSQRKRPQVTK